VTNWNKKLSILFHPQILQVVIDDEVVLLKALLDELEDTVPDDLAIEIDDDEMYGD
jgi:hypothetical protein